MSQCRVHAQINWDNFFHCLCYSLFIFSHESHTQSSHISSYTFTNVTFQLMTRLVKPFPFTSIDSVTNAILITAPVIGLMIPGAPIKEGNVFTSSIPYIHTFNVLVVSTQPPFLDWNLVKNIWFLIYGPLNSSTRWKPNELNLPFWSVLIPFLCELCDKCQCQSPPMDSVDSARV